VAMLYAIRPSSSLRQQALCRADRRRGDGLQVALLLAPRVLAEAPRHGAGVVHPRTCTTETKG
jgi:hypothetical protein